MERTPLGGRIQWRVRRSRGVALTFDDGPHPEYTPQVLDVLARYGARATFFLVGEHVERYPELVRRIAAEGHTIGNHTYSHARCRTLDLPALTLEMQRTDAALAVALGGPLPDPPPFRPPFGELRAAQALHLAMKGRSVVFWNQDVRDYRGASPAEIAALGPALGAGDIVLLHDRFPGTVEALPQLLESLQQSGIAALPLHPSDVSDRSLNGHATTPATLRTL